MVRRMEVKAVFLLHRDGQIYIHMIAGREIFERGTSVDVAVYVECFSCVLLDAARTCWVRCRGYSVYRRVCQANAPSYKH